MVSSRRTPGQSFHVHMDGTSRLCHPRGKSISKEKTEGRKKESPAPVMERHLHMVAPPTSVPKDAQNLATSVTCGDGTQLDGAVEGHNFCSYLFMRISSHNFVLCIQNTTVLKKVESSKWELTRGAPREEKLSGEGHGVPALLVAHTRLSNKSPLRASLGSGP